MGLKCSWVKYVPQQSQVCSKNFRLRKTVLSKIWLMYSSWENERKIKEVAENCDWLCELTFKEKDTLYFGTSLIFSRESFSNRIYLCNIPIRIFLWLGTCYLTTFDATLDLKCLPEYKLLQLTYELPFFFLSFYLHSHFFGSTFLFWSYVRLQTWNFLQCTLSCYKMMINIHTSMHWNLKVTPKFSPDQEHSKLISNLTASSFEFHNLNLNVNQGHAAEI